MVIILIINTSISLFDLIFVALETLIFLSTLAHTGFKTNLVQARLNNTQVSVDTVGELLGVILTFHFRLSCFS
eukprot:m.185120 g.185120  ORF g.185120 m.185120 type:complete len:73 (-) comp25557_c0_seq1:101-319(-)